MYEISLRTPQHESFPLPLWLHPEFLEAVAALQHCQAWQLLCHKGDQCVAMMPLYEKLNLGLRRLICPQSAYYQGLWFFWEDGRARNRNLLDELKVSADIAQFLKARYKRLHFNLAPHNLDTRGFTWAGFRAKPLYTFTHSLRQPLEPLIDERRKLRSAMKQDYRLEEGFRPEEFIDLLKEQHQRKEQRFGLPYQGWEQWMRRLHGQDLLAQFNLLRGQRIISSNLLLGGTHDRVAYSIMICTLPEEMKNGASTRHYYELVSSLAQRWDKIDFCGGNISEVARFKAALGLTLRPFFQLKG
ncbi:MAG TPA: hypothetical protein PKH19_00935 [Candidatus Syntrophosphaera sp.]|nr:hypothetical protein [Candidatus Syntrophosphaera sp.]